MLRSFLDKAFLHSSNFYLFLDLGHAGGTWMFAPEIFSKPKLNHLETTQGSPLDLAEKAHQKQQLMKRH